MAMNEIIMLLERSAVYKSDRNFVHVAFVSILLDDALPPVIVVDPVLPQYVALNIELFGCHVSAKGALGADSSLHLNK